MLRRSFIALFWVTALLGWAGPSIVGALTHRLLPPEPTVVAPMPLPVAALAPAVTDTAIAGPIALAAAPLVQTQYRYYPIYGSTAAELRSQLNHQGPVSPIEGRQYDANTDWTVHWSYHYSQAGSQCAIATAENSVEVLFTLPRWENAAQGSAVLVADWQRYMTALQLHEEGHRDNALAAGQAVLQTLNQFPPYPSCHQLQVAADATLQHIIAQHNRRDIEYDRVTQHGRTQGATFP